MIRLLLVVGLIVAAVGCDSPVAPTSAPPVPPFTPAPSPLVPRMVDEGVPLTVLPDPAGFRLRGRVRNDGETCGTHIEGLWLFTVHEGAPRQSSQVPRGRVDYTIAWAIDPTVIVRPGDYASYEACCLPPAVSGQELTYTGLITADPIVCP